MVFFTGDISCVIHAFHHRSHNLLSSPDASVLTGNFYVIRNVSTTAYTDYANKLPTLHATFFTTMQNWLISLCACTIFVTAGISCAIHRQQLPSHVHNLHCSSRRLHHRLYNLHHNVHLPACSLHLRHRLHNEHLLLRVVNIGNCHF